MARANIEEILTGCEKILWKVTDGRRPSRGGESMAGGTDLVVRGDEHTGAQLKTYLTCSRAGFSHFPMCVFIRESHLDEHGLAESDETRQ